jgi:hypothetical protein
VGSRRKKLGLSVRAAANDAGIDRATWTALEAGTRTIQDRHHAAIEGVLQWQPGAIATYLEDGATLPPSHTTAVDDGDAPLVVRMSADELAELIMEVQDASGREAADKLLADVRRKRAEWAKKAHPTSAADQPQAG